MLERSIEFRTDAEAELLSACDWFDEIDPDLADRFYQEVITVAGRAARGPLTYPYAIESEPFRIAPVACFSYSVMYCENPDHLTIVAVAHSSRDFGYWRDR